MGKYNDLMGERFGRLTVIEKADAITNKNGRIYHRWLCRCDCGTKVIVKTYSLTYGEKRSCGCYQNEINSITHTKHGLRKNALYGVWQSMKTRCYNNKHRYYKDYGGRGVTICDEWKNDFKAFHDWAIRNGYKKGLTIDRIDSDGNYCLDNCRWATKKVQTRSRRNTITLMHNGETRCLKEWSEITGISYINLYRRYKEGKCLDEIFKK